MPRTLSSLTLAEARRMIAAGERKADELKIPYNLAVVDAGGALLAQIRMDGAWLGSIQLAIDKAWTARAFERATDQLATVAQSGQPAFGIHTSNSGRVVIFGGGVPVSIDAVVIGAVGASGGTVEQDIVVARAAVAALT